MNQLSKADVVHDFAFIGLGASNSLILLSLIQSGLTSNKKILICEGDAKTENDKTYCFWANDNEKIVSDFDSIISYRFDKIKLSDNSIKSIDSQPYHYIRSIDLYDFVKEEISKKSNIQLVCDYVEDITPNSSLNSINTTSNSYLANYIFDSRPQKITLTSKNEIFLNQSFLGFHIECNSNSFDVEVFEMMNFSVEQNGSTQFVYLIPFSKKSALIEFTRFGVEKLDEKYAEEQLDRFISEKYGSYRVLHKETGSIPMTNARVPHHNSSKILRTGASANLIKPSTGYGFKNMHQFAELVTHKIQNNNLNRFNEIGLPSKKRFRLYDQLLLFILCFRPIIGKRIFSKLFSSIPIITIFNFLDEKTSLLDEIKIFSKLPLIPFLNASLRVLVNYISWRFVVVTIFVLLYMLTDKYFPYLESYYSYASLITGFFIIGIPHGAIDYLISKNSNTRMYLFLTKYILLMILNLLVWWLNPTLALIFFLGYSFFHFGESEWIQAGGETKSVLGKIYSFFTGMSILVFILSTHTEESVHLIFDLTGFNFAQSIFYQIPLSLFSIFFLVLTQMNHARNNLLGLLTLLIFGLFLPLFHAFWLYFIFQHSFNAWSHLKKGLSLSSSQLFQKALLYNIGAFLLFALFMLNFGEILKMSNFWSLIFVFISSISFPHCAIMHFYYKKTNLIA